MKTHYLKMGIHALQDRVDRAEASFQLKDLLDHIDMLTREVSDLERELRDAKEHLELEIVRREAFQDSAIEFQHQAAISEDMFRESEKRLKELDRLKAENIKLLRRAERAEATQDAAATMLELAIDAYNDDDPIVARKWVVKASKMCPPVVKKRWIFNEMPHPIGKCTCCGEGINAVKKAIDKVKDLTDEERSDLFGQERKKAAWRYEMGMTDRNEDEE